jgi:putative ABC transport system permease protein
VEAPVLAFYRPLAQEYSPQMTLVIRSPGDPGFLVATVRREIQSKNRDLAIVNSRTLDEQLHSALSSSRHIAILLGGVCIAGLLLTAVGLYGVVASAVRERVREFGVRVALGAQSRDIRSMVLTRGLRLAVAGLGIGLAAALGVTRILTSVLYGVDRNDPLTLFAVTLLMVAVSLAASYLPARWATKVDPSRALRVD